MPSIQAIANALSDTFTDDRYGVGTTYLQTDAEVASLGSGVDATLTWSLLKGEREWIFVKAAEAILAGQLCETDAADPFFAEPCDGDSVDPMLLLGVADHDIDAGSYGWLVRRGTCVVLAETSLIANVAVDSDGAGAGEGYVEATAGAGSSIGRTLEAEGDTLATYAQVYINIP